MENQDKDEHRYRHDHTAEEFSTANPNTNYPAQPIVPEYTEKENQRLDTDPNRYNNFENPDDQGINQEGSANEDLSHYSAEDDRIQLPVTAHQQKSPEETGEEKQESSESDSPQLNKNQSEFFEGL
jgi:hypothetical protein